MKSAIHLLILLVTILCVIPTSPCFAQWNKNPSINNPIATTSTADYFPYAVPDGAGGSIVLFEKVGVGNDIYAQKITADGIIAWGSPASPVVICNATSEQYSIHAIADGAGGAFLCWYDFRHDAANAEIYVQHINSSGTASWTANGVRVTNTAAIDEYEPYLCSDGAGGIIIAWNWENFVDNLQINAQRYTSSGTPLWTGNGVQVCTAPGFRDGQGIISDGSNGAIITFRDTRNDPHGLLYSDFIVSDMVNVDIYAQRISGTGERVWGDNALPVCAATGNQDNYFFTTIVPDGSGGAVIAYNDGRVDIPDINHNPTNQDLYAQRLNSSGAPQWALNGVPITTAPGNQYFYEMIADAANGFVLAWGNEVLEGVYSQRLSHTGVPLWTAGGVAVSPASSPSYEAVLAADGNGNYIYAYNAPFNNNNLEAQKLNINGAIQWGGTGIVVCNATNASAGRQKIVLSNSGSVILAWRDSRSFATNRYDIYGSKVLASGILAGTGAYITIANGDWSNPAIWQGGLVPDGNAEVTVRHTVSITSNASCYSLIVEQPGGNLTVSPGIILTITH